MKYTKECDSCHHVVAAYTYNLNVGKVLALRKLVDYYETMKTPADLGNLGLSNSQYTNFCHLQYFDLARHIPEGWIPTPAGIDFIYGQRSVTVPAAVMGGVVLSPDHEAWRSHQSAREEVFVFDITETAYKRRPAYVAEKAPSLFAV